MLLMAEGHWRVQDPLSHASLGKSVTAIRRNYHVPSGGGKSRWFKGQRFYTLLLSEIAGC
jgi:hypothetical protein